MTRSTTFCVQCPWCGGPQSRVVQTSKIEGNAQLRRRRCLSCGKSLYTLQPPETIIETWRIRWKQNGWGGGRMVGVHDAPEIEEKSENIEN